MLLSVKVSAGLAMMLCGGVACQAHDQGKHPDYIYSPVAGHLLISENVAVLDFAESEEPELAGSQLVGMVKGDIAPNNVSFPPARTYDGFGPMNLWDNDFRRLVGRPNPEAAKMFDVMSGCLTSVSSSNDNFDRSGPFQGSTCVDGCNIKISSQLMSCSFFGNRDLPRRLISVYLSDPEALLGIRSRVTRCLDRLPSEKKAIKKTADPQAGQDSLPNRDVRHRLGGSSRANLRWKVFLGAVAILVFAACYFRIIYLLASVPQVQRPRRPES